MLDERDFPVQEHALENGLQIRLLPDRGLPITTVNIAKLGISVYRVNERGLDKFIERYYATFPGTEPMTESWSLRQWLSGENGKRIWRGTMEVKNVLNQPITTAFYVLIFSDPPATPTVPDSAQALAAIRSHLQWPLKLPNVARNVIAHELGHAIGLGHNDDPAMLMCGRPAPCRPDAMQSDTPRIFPLTAGEREELRRMYSPRAD